MINNYQPKYYNEVCKLGKLINPNFTKLFHINKLNINEEIYVFEEKDIVKGFIHIQNGLDITDILNIVVDPIYQNQGIGSKLINYVYENNKSQKLMLEVRAQNKEAINFYQKNKFIILNVRKNYYQNDDAIIMERK